MLQVRGAVAELQIDLRYRDGNRLPMLVNTVRRTLAGQVRDEWTLCGFDHHLAKPIDFERLRSVLAPGGLAG